MRIAIAAAIFQDREQRRLEKNLDFGNLASPMLFGFGAAAIKGRIVSGGIVLIDSDKHCMFALLY